MESYKEIYNLNQDVPESFPFELNGHTYTMRYPTTDEVAEILKEPDNDVVNAKIYGFISGDEGAPPIETAIGSTNFKVGNRFLKMVKEEFFAEDQI